MVINTVKFLVLILFSISTYAAQIDVAVDRNPTIINESFQVTFTAIESPDGVPDFSPLKQNFDILNQQKSSQLSWVNGKSSQSIQWVVSLMARHTGKQIIPAISFGNDASKPLAITVNNALSNSLSSTYTNDELFLEAEATPKQAYVQSQILYTLRFYQRVNIIQATLNDPNVENAVVEKLADDVTFNTKMNGVNYRVTERKYAIFPQKSGSLTISPLVLTAQVLVDAPRDRFDSFFSTHKTETKRVISEAINLDVLASPIEKSTEHWLPAQDLKLTQTWSNNNLQVQVGEPITRTLKIHAKGLMSSQLPDLSVQSMDPSVKVYPDKISNEDQKSTNGITAIQEQKIAFIPNQAGNFELPAIEIPWFNTQTKKMEVAQLPAINLHAIAPENVAITGDHSIVDTSVSKTPMVNNDDKSTKSDVTIWMITTFAFACVWLITLLFWARSRFKKAEDQEKNVSEKSLKLNNIVAELESACMKNSSRDASKALRLWGGLMFGTTNMDAISLYCDPNLQAEILILSQCEYSQKNFVWDGKVFWNKFNNKNIKKLNDTNNNHPLIPLNPI